jgi:fatty acid desaturase
MSLQHELLHGHPTRSKRINRMLGLAPLAVWYPYDIYRDSHLSHHRDEFLTHPGVDPESNYVEAATYRRQPRWVKACWVLQRTVLGRVLLGPAFVIIPTWIGIVRDPLQRNFSQLRCWAEHLTLLALLLWVLAHYAGIEPWQYVLASAYPALGLAMLRSFYLISDLAQ